MNSAAPAPRPSRWKPLLDFGPLLVFLVVNAKWGILPATAALVPLSVLTLFLSWKLEGKVSRVALYGTVAVILFGGLTVLLRDERFIKLKVTAINALLGAILAIGLLRGKPLLKELLGEGLRMTDAGWRALSLRFALFFFALAGLNEVLRRVLSTDAWVQFKVFGILGATFLFTILQTPLIQKHGLEEPEKAEG